MYKPDKRTDWSVGRFYKTCENFVWIIGCQLCAIRNKKFRVVLVHCGSLMIQTFWNPTANLETTMSMHIMHKRHNVWNMQIVHVLCLNNGDLYIYMELIFRPIWLAYDFWNKNMIKGSTTPIIDSWNFLRDAYEKLVVITFSTPSTRDNAIGMSCLHRGVL